MLTDDPASILHTLFDALNDHEAGRAAAQLAASYRGLDTTRSAVTEGREAARAEIQTGLDAFAPTFSVRQCVSDPPHVTVFWRMEAVHEGPFLQIPPTHRSIEISGTGLFTVRNGKIARGVHLWDLAGLLRAVGLLPDLPGDGAETSGKADASIFGSD